MKEDNICRHKTIKAANDMYQLMMELVEKYMRECDLNGDECWSAFSNATNMLYASVVTIERNRNNTSSESALQDQEQYVKKIIEEVDESDRRKAH